MNKEAASHMGALHLGSALEKAGGYDFEVQFSQLQSAP